MTEIAKQRLIRIGSVSLALLAVMGVSHARAGGFPSKPVTIVIPYTEGSATDVVARMVGAKLSGIWGQTVTYENKAGAGGSLGADVVAKAPADGYTLLAGSSSHVVNPALYKSLPYDPGKAFVDVAPLARQAMAFVTGASGKVGTLSDLIAVAKADPGKLSFGSPGVGSSGHFAFERFMAAAGVSLAHVPFKGGPEAIAATLDGRVICSILPVSITLKGVREGKLRVLGVTSPKRVTELPEAPTVAEAGVAGYEHTVWWGVWAPGGTPADVVAKIAKDVAAALTAPEVLEQLKKGGFEPMSMSSSDFARFVRSETETAAKIAKTAGIKPQ